MKIAVVQQPPVYLDKAKSIRRAVELMSDAATQGCGLIVFPEAWLPGYPTFVWRLSPGADMKKTDELFHNNHTCSLIALFWIKTYFPMGTTIYLAILGEENGRKIRSRSKSF